MVDVPPGMSETGKRQRRYFEKKREAESYAKLIQAKLATFQERTILLAPDVRKQTVRALDLLGRSSSRRRLAFRLG